MKLKPIKVSILAVFTVVTDLGLLFGASSELTNKDTVTAAGLVTVALVLTTTVILTSLVIKVRRQTQ